jgi:hypothetical protein
MEARQPIGILNLNALVPLFRDEAALDQFIAAILQKVVANSLTILTRGDTAIATMKSAVNAREEFQLRIAAKMAEDPHLLETLKERAEDDKFVECGTFDAPE